MSQSIRFLGFAILTWAGVRALSLGLIPGIAPLAVNSRATPDDTSTATSIPPIAPTRFEPVEPMVPAGLNPPPDPAGTTYAYAPYGPYGYPPYGAYPPRQAVGYGAPSAPLPYPYPFYIPVQQAAYRQSTPTPRAQPFGLEPTPRSGWLDGAPDPDPYPMSRLASGGPVRPSVQITPPMAADPPGRGYDRWQLSSWAMLRSRPGPAALAANGMLGGSQAGARIIYRFDPRLGISLRTTSALQSREQGVEVAGGLRVQPFRSIPAAITVERRQWVGKGIGRSDFALFAEGGVWGKPLPMGLRFDGYLQAGVVGIQRRDWFVDGSAAATRPIWRNLSGGVGVWGGAQSGLQRLDAGPRLTLDMGKGMRIHADYRAKLVGNAEPGSGGVVTLAGDF